jgi:hypothetical protein
VDGHRAGPFTGLVICTTNFNMQQRQAVEAAVVQGGGVFSPELQKGVCTHLVCGKPDGPKYKCGLPACGPAGAGLMPAPRLRSGLLHSALQSLAAMSG